MHDETDPPIDDTPDADVDDLEAGAPGDEDELTLAEDGLDGDAEIYVAEEDMTISQVLSQVQTGDLHDAIVQKYAGIGVKMLSDALPQQLDTHTTDYMEGILGKRLGDIRIHTGEKAKAAAEAIGARAFVLGSRDIFFGDGEFNVDTQEGRAVLAHELTHTLQPHVAFAPKMADDSGSGDEEDEARGAEERVMAKDDDPAKGAKKKSDGGSDASGDGGGGGGDGGGGSEKAAKDDEFFGVKANEFVDLFFEYYLRMDEQRRERLGWNDL